MNLRKRHRLHAEVSTHSLNDIMFFLLLFFLIVSTMVSPNVIKLILPNAKGAKDVSKKTITLEVNEKKEYALDNLQITYEQIEPALMDLLKKNVEPTVILKVDKTIQVQELVDVLTIGNKLKVKMVLATQTGNK